MDDVASSERGHAGARGERRASYLELFFDLVFVYAVTQVATLILGDTSPGGFAARGADAGDDLVGVVGVRVDDERHRPQHRHRPGRAPAGVGELVLRGARGARRRSARRASGSPSPTSLVRVLHLVVYLYGIRNDPVYQRGRPALAAVLAGVARADRGRRRSSTARAHVDLGLVAVALDIAGALIAGRQEYRVSASHFAERYQLFVIIALGESIVAIGDRHRRPGARPRLRPGRRRGLLRARRCSGGRTSTSPAVGGERALHAGAEDHARQLARDVYTFCHFPMIAGIILYAVAAKKTVAHPGDVLSTAGRFALAAGSRSTCWASSARAGAPRRLAWERIAAAVTVPLLVLALRGADALLVMAAALLLLSAWIAVEAVRLRDVRAPCTWRSRPTRRDGLPYPPWTVRTLATCDGSHDPRRRLWPSPHRALRGRHDPRQSRRRRGGQAEQREHALDVEERVERRRCARRGSRRPAAPTARARRSARSAGTARRPSSRWPAPGRGATRGTERPGRDASRRCPRGPRSHSANGGMRGVASSCRSVDQRLDVVALEGVDVAREQLLLRLVGRDPRRRSRPGSAAAIVARARCRALLTEATDVSSSSATSSACQCSTSRRISTARCFGGSCCRVARKARRMVSRASATSAGSPSADTTRPSGIGSIQWPRAAWSSWAEATVETAPGPSAAPGAGGP